jgi:site-specific DNA-methyltransferase (adenine-specific)
MIRCGDAVDLLREIPDDGVDVCLTDPPYSEHVHANHFVGGNPVKGTPTRRKKAKPTKKDLGFVSLSRPLRAQIAHEVARVTKRWVLIFSDHEGSVGWANDLRYAGLELVRYAIWRKLGAPPQFTGDRPAVGHEVIVIAHRPPPGNKKQWNGGGHHGVYEYAIERGKNRVHTTQKPAPLCDKLVELYTNPGETVLDAFAGSGAILAAAARAGRRPYGIEIDRHYADLSAEAVHRALASYDPLAGLLRPGDDGERQGGVKSGAVEEPPNGDSDSAGALDADQLDLLSYRSKKKTKKKAKAKR